MNKLVRLRSEIDDLYKWDLSSIYNDEEDFLRDYDNALRMINEFKKYDGIMLSSPSVLNECICAELSISRLLEKLYSYASLKESEDTSNNYAIDRKEKVVNLYNTFSENAYFVKPTLLSISYEEIKAWYDLEPSLKKHDRSLKNLFRYKDHCLSSDEERLLSNLSVVFGNVDRTYSTFTNSDLKFGNIIDEDGVTYELADTSYRKFIESFCRRVRKDAFTTLYKTYRDYSNTFASLMDAHVKEENAISRIKKYDSTLQRFLFPDEASVDVYNNLIDTVSGNLDVLFEYYDIKKKALDVDELHLYDLYTSIIPSYDKKYSFDEGKRLVLNALSVLGDDYINNLSKAFSEKWIDVYPNLNKTTGAYSGGSYDTKPYVLLNYLDNYDNVSTLAHELGHSMHSYYSRTCNDYEYGDYAIIIAEVASTVNELLLANYMLKNSTSKQEKLFILDQLMELFKGTIFRQCMFSEFEKKIYESSSEGVVLTSSYLCDLYYSLNKKYFGDGVVVDDEIKYEWERIPHFYYNFYVYKYATGLSAACHIVKRILNNEEGAKDSYLKFLSLGSSIPPLDALKVAGVDLTKSEVIESAIGMFRDIVNDFKKEYNK